MVDVAAIDSQERALAARVKLYRDALIFALFSWVAGLLVSAIPLIFAIFFEFFETRESTEIYSAIWHERYREFIFIVIAISARSVVDFISDYIRPSGGSEGTGSIAIGALLGINTVLLIVFLILGGLLYGHIAKSSAIEVAQRYIGITNRILPLLVVSVILLSLFQKLLLAQRSIRSATKVAVQ
jgi:hypothetical protein